MKDILTPSLSTKLVDQVAAVMKAGQITEAAKVEAAVVDPALAESTSKYMDGFRGSTSPLAESDRVSWNDMRSALMEAGHPALIVKNMDNQKLRVAYDRLEEAQGSASRVTPMRKSAKMDYKDARKPRNDYDRSKRTVKEPVDEEVEAIDEVQGSMSRAAPMRKSAKMAYADSKKPRNDYDRTKRTVKEPMDEEVEEIAETSTEFRGRYQRLAKAILDKKKKGRPTEVHTAMKTRRAKGMETAGKLNQKAANKRWDKAEQDEAELHDHITKKLPGILKAHGYTAVGKGGLREPHTLYAKHHPEHGLITHVKVLHTPEGATDKHMIGRNIAKFGSSTGWQSSDDHHNAETWSHRVGEKPIGERKANAEKRFTDKIRAFETYHKAKSLEESVAESDTLDMLDEALVGKAARSAVQAGLVYAKHHEEINDLLGGIAKHLKAHAKDAAANPWGNGEDHKGPNWGHVGSVEHYRNQLQNIHDSLAGRGQYAEETAAEGDELNEELTEAEWFALEEAKRGRPRKNPMPDADGAEEQGSEASQNIVNQLRKAAGSGLKPYHVAFEDGDKQPVTRSQARKALSKFDSKKPSEKEAMQAHMSQSHANLMTHFV